MAIQTKRYTYTLAGNQVMRVDVQGEFYKITSASGSVTVQRSSGGSAITGLLPGQGETAPFDFLTIKDETGAANTVTILIGASTFIDDRPVLVIPNGPVVHTNPAVGAASGQLLAAKPTRQFLFIQNNDAALDVWFTTDGSAATIGGKSIRIKAGQYFDMDNFVPTGQVNAISSGGANANVAVMEG